jgi:DNA helicase TIP49 (TBP-interacting protein)
MRVSDKTCFSLLEKEIQVRIEGIIKKNICDEKFQFIYEALDPMIDISMSSVLRYMIDMVGRESSGQPDE